jgi:FKBP-type peptidyl-prolyl cis-trans isomerase
MRIATILALALAPGCGRGEPEKPSPPADSTPRAPVVVSTPLAQPIHVDKGDGLRVEIVARGSGAEVASTSSVELHYEAYVAGSEKPFDSTSAGGSPLVVHLGAQGGLRVIEGLARGLVGLRAGDRARISIPPALGWSETAREKVGVPADAELVYEVRVVGVE